MEEFLKSLLNGEHSSLTLSFNDITAPNYATVKEYNEKWSTDNEPYDWVSDEEKAKAIELNSMWCLHWYPDTPGGFFSVAANSLDVLLKYVKENEFK